jgi:hypothetical protein
MHQYKTVAQILLILSIFNPVLAAPVVRDIYDAHDDVAAPTAVENVAVMSKERHQSRSDVTTSSPSSPPLPEGSTTSHSSPLLPPFLYASSSSDREGSPHERSPTSPDVPATLYDPSPSDGEGSLHELPTHPDEPTSLHVSSLPSEVATNPAPWPYPPASPADAASIQRLEETMEMREMAKTFLKKLGVGLAVLGVAGGAVAVHQKLNHHHRTIDPDWYVCNPLADA